MTEKKDPKDTQWKKGVSGNPGGKSKGQRKNEIAAAKIAASLRLKTLASMQALLAEKDLTPDDFELLLSSGALNLFKQSEDRAWGTAQQHVDNTSKDGSMTPTRIVHEIVTPKEQKE
tara:strand:- start:294 stop:644 length:351 start_codon:yes stop_codon:yes gene_type:complete